MPALPALERGQSLDSLSRSLLGQAQLVEALQVEPEFGAGAEEVAEAQGGIASNGALAIQDPGDAVSRYLQLTRELRGADVQRLQFLGELVAGVNCKPCHVSLTLVIIHDLDVDRTRCTFRPLETDPP